MEPGHVPSDTLLNVSPDGRCTTHCLLAAFDVKQHAEVPRDSSGSPKRSKDAVGVTAGKCFPFIVSHWCFSGGIEGRACRRNFASEADEVNEKEKIAWEKRFRSLADGEHADHADFRILSEAIGHHIVVESAFNSVQPLQV